MRTRFKFVKQVLGFTLKDIKRLEVKFDPLEANALNIREFYHGVAERRCVRSNPDCRLLANIVCDRSDPTVNVTFQDDHKLVINAKHLESNHIVQLINQIKPFHAKTEV